MDIKEKVTQRVPVRLLDSSGAGITGVAFSAVTVYLQGYGTAAAVKTMAAPDWIEIDATNFPGVYDLRLVTDEVSPLGQLKYSVAASGAVTYVGIVNVIEYLSGDVFTQASSANTNAAGASASATTAATNASNAYTAATTAASNASTAATNASNAQTAATTAATNAANAETAANTAATNASNAETAATTAAGLAGTAATNAANAQFAATLGLKIARGRLKIDTGANTCTVYDDDGITPLYVWNLFDGAGAPTSSTIYERVPV